MAWLAAWGWSHEAHSCRAVLCLLGEQSEQTQTERQELCSLHSALLPTHLRDWGQLEQLKEAGLLISLNPGRAEGLDLGSGISAQPQVDVQEKGQG